MIGPTFGYVKDEHLLAILKRVISVLVLRHRLVVRLPSEDPDAPVHVFTAENVHKDLLKPDNKPYLAKQKEGNAEKYPGYDNLVVDELTWLKSILNAPVGQPQHPPTARAGAVAGR